MIKFKKLTVQKPPKTPFGTLNNPVSALKKLPAAVLGLTLLLTACTAPDLDVSGTSPDVSKAPASQNALSKSCASLGSGQPSGSSIAVPSGAFGSSHKSSTSSVPSKDTTPPEEFEPFYPTEKVIAFTFDDGPDWMTPQILDVIEGTEDKVSFFITGYMMDMNPKYKEHVKRATEMGCDVGLHTYNHKNLYYASKKEDAPEELIRSELGDIDRLYTELTGKKTFLLRPPGGALNKERNYGYASVLWSVDSEDWRIWSNHRTGLLSSDKTVKEQATKEAVAEIKERVLNLVKPGDIVLMHDVYETSALAFKEIYKELKAQGYRFVTVSVLLNIDPAEYTGWYFYDSGRCGLNGELRMARRTALSALPPEKSLYE